MPRAEFAQDDCSCFFRYPRQAYHRAMRSLCLLFSSLTCAALFAAAPQFELHPRTRVRSAADTNAWQVVERTATWDPARTAVVICDMWDKHHCPDATERVGEMAPRMNEMIKAARPDWASHFDHFVKLLSELGAFSSTLQEHPCAGNSADEK